MHYLAYLRVRQRSSELATPLQEIGTPLHYHWRRAAAGDVDTLVVHVGVTQV